jgi:hypothetical protein
MYRPTQDVDVDVDGWKRRATKNYPSASWMVEEETSTHRGPETAQARSQCHVEMRLCVYPEAQLSKDLLSCIYPETQLSFS